MFKMFAIMCILVNGEPQCTYYNDALQQTFDDRIVCEEAAGARFYEMMAVFEHYGVPYEEIKIGCEEIDSNS
jgi:hypothetical protein